tara:strand:+ start:351 stop:827 length:477 start_codon:yes stop_codon:yes gene_type:complete
LQIRKVIKSDNPQLAKVIRGVLNEMKVPAKGTAFADKELDNMHEAYSFPRSVYFVVESGSQILGGAGVMPLNKGPKNICELQKMYLHPMARGKGIGSDLLKLCLSFAKINKFSLCYLETMPYMKNAQKLYKKNGFIYINAPMGDTGHYSCPIWMTKEL